jgi:hypothetical protein
MSSLTEKEHAQDRKRARPVTPNKVVHSYRDFSRLPPGKSALDEADIKEFTTFVHEPPVAVPAAAAVAVPEDEPQELSASGVTAAAAAAVVVPVPVPIKKCRGTYCNFPTKLHQILSSEEFSNAIAWMPHGRSFRVIKPKEFAETISPRFFNHSNFPSFARQVNGWGFRRITQGPDRNSYYHELFLRWRPHLVKWMRRPDKVGKQMPDPANEPNFYSISERFPLPFPAECAPENTNSNSAPIVSNNNEDETSLSRTPSFPTSSIQHQHQHYLMASPPRSSRFNTSLSGSPRHSPYRGEAHKETVSIDISPKGHYDPFEPPHNRFSQHHPPHTNSFAPHYDSRVRGFQQEYFTPSSPARRRESSSYGQQQHATWGSQNNYSYSPERAIHFPHVNNTNVANNYSSVPVNKSRTRENNRIQFSTRQVPSDTQSQSQMQNILPDATASRRSPVLRDDNNPNTNTAADSHEHEHYDSSYHHQNKMHGTTRPREELHVTYAMAHNPTSGARMGANSRVRHGWIMRGASSAPGSPEIQKYVRDSSFDQQGQGIEHTMHDPRHFEDHPRPYSRVVSHGFPRHYPANYAPHHHVSRGDIDNESRMKSRTVWPLEAEREKMEELPHMEQQRFIVGADDFDVLASKKESNMFDK